MNRVQRDTSEENLLRGEIEIEWRRLCQGFRYAFGDVVGSSVHCWSGEYTKKGLFLSINMSAAEKIEKLESLI